MFLHVPKKSLFLIFYLPVLIFSLLAFSAWSFPSKAHVPSYPVQISTDISYGPHADEVLDQCIPLTTPFSRPGIIMIHGGSWSGGDKSHYENLCSAYAAEGYVVTTINYRLAPLYQWPDQIGDVQLAIRYMRVNASRTGLDPTRICALGDSAGAHLALLLDELRTVHPADVANLYPDTSPAVQCVVDQFGPADLTQLYYENPNVQRDISDLLDDQTPPAAIYQDASPVDNITPQTGSVLIIQGSSDQTVLPDQSWELRQDLQNAAIPFQYISYDGGHEYRGLTLDQRDAILAQVNSFLLAVEQP